MESSSSSSTASFVNLSSGSASSTVEKSGAQMLLGERDMSDSSAKLNSLFERIFRITVNNKYGQQGENLPHLVFIGEESGDDVMTANKYLSKDNLDEVRVIIKSSSMNSLLGYGHETYT